MKIDVNGMIWRIFFTNDKENLKRSDGSLTFGVTDCNLLSVFISNKLSRYMLKKVLTHELTHVWIFSYDYYLTIEEEEFICSFMDEYAEDIINKVYDVINGKKYI